MRRVLRSRRPRGAPIGPDLVARVGFTDHAIKRFAQRAGLGTSNRRVVEPIVRELLIDEGYVVAERPGWARSRRDAELLLQLGQWMLLIGCRDPRRPGCYSIVTAIIGEDREGWRRGWRLGLISTPPPMPPGPRRPSLFVSVVCGLWYRRSGEGPVGSVRRTHRTRRADAQSMYEQALLERWCGGRPFSRHPAGRSRTPTEPSSSRGRAP
jgi:hypothetical protein